MDAGRNGTLRKVERPIWADWPDSRLLNLRLCDLGIGIATSPALRKRIAQVRDELAARGLRFTPHFWLAEDWFSPDGVPGVAIPFCLAHPRLLRLERRMTGEVEGSTATACLRILRHEVGHAIDHAYLLHRRRDWQALFGRSSLPYPAWYQPRPGSREFVLHLDSWYAQSHPDEDFAETFAVWLTPSSAWKRLYCGWPAFRKVRYVDALMQEIGAQRPINTCRAELEPLADARKTLGEYYEQKRARSRRRSRIYDRDLRRLFKPCENGWIGRSAASFIRSCRRELQQGLQAAAYQEKYNLDQVLKEMIGRCRELKLQAVRERPLKARFLNLVAARRGPYIRSARQRVLV